jgi:ferredoxin-thioredoxin reductase catalytic chain
MEVGPSTEDVARMRHFAEHYARKTGTAFHPGPEVTEAVLQGVARHRPVSGPPLEGQENSGSAEYPLASGE